MGEYATPEDAARADGWVDSQGVSGGGSLWLATSDDGVRTEWDERFVEWEVPAPDFEADENW